MADKDFKLEVQGKTISVEFKDLAPQASGNLLIRMGDTMVLCCATMSGLESAHQGFFPLMVEYEEKYYAAGKILGSRFMRREGRPSDEAIITSRVIDRAIRPLFPKHLRREVQAIASVLSWDGTNDADVISLIGTSLALSVSNIPWAGPVGAIRIGRVDGKLVSNPTYEERKLSDLDFLMAGVEEEGEVFLNMIEAEGNEVAENVWEEAVSMGLPEIKRLIEFQKEIAGKRGTAKLELAKPAPDASLREEVKALVGKHLQEAFFEAEKAKRMEQVQNLRHKVEDAISSAYPNTFKGREAGDIFEEMLDATMREAILTKGERVDGRKPEEIREVAGEAALLPRTHGSGVFRRGETTTLSILTLGTPGDQRLQEGMEIRGKKRFMHHYNFPPYSVGEVRPLRGPGRRDIGHGMLAEKALLPVIPTIDEFPYTIRIVTEVTSSNGSSSMASACSSSLALMDAGVPITRPVAGIAVGLIAKGSEYKLLADIQGPEDHHGDMDFKVAGTTEGVTAIQMDVKLRGITKAIFAEALETAKRARLQILETAILPTLAAPRPELSEWAPRIHVLHINPDKIGGLIGPGGKMIRQIIEECEVEIDVEDDGTVFVTADRPESAGKALEWIRGITREIEVGEVFEGVVKKVAAFGAFIEIAPGQEGLVHISELSDKRVERVEDVLKHGDMVTVRVIGIDEQGKIRLSVKQAT